MSTPKTPTVPRTAARRFSPGSRRQPTPVRTLVLAGVLVVVVLLIASAAPRASTLGDLNSELGRQQARQLTLQVSIGRISHLIATLNGQITLVEQREAAVRADLARDQAELARTRAALVRERAVVDMLKARLARAQLILSRQLVSNYEGAKPDLMSVVLEAHGFNDLLEQLDFLHRAEQQQQSVITVTRVDESAADAAERRLAALEKTDATITEQAAVRVRALAGMNILLHSRQAALGRARAAQQAALQASRARGRKLQAAIARIQAEQAAAARAALATTGAGATPTATGPALGPSSGWAIPYAIVLCESGGQNLSPNSAGASGYYQILPATWKLFGGSGPAAYLAGKAEQDAVAARIWNGGAGASNWVCAGIVGIH